MNADKVNSPSESARKRGAESAELINIKVNSPSVRVRKRGVESAELINIKVNSPSESGSEERGGVNRAH